MDVPKDDTRIPTLSGFASPWADHAGEAESSAAATSITQTNLFMTHTSIVIRIPLPSQGRAPFDEKA